MAECKALTRINNLLDEGSFVELGGLVTGRVSDFSIKENQAPSDGIITGYGQIDGFPVFVYSQNSDVLNGTIGEAHAKKIINIYEKAIAAGAPVVGFIDCGGFRLEESVDALDAFAKILEVQIQAKGQIAQYVAIVGNCGGGMNMVPALADFAFMAKGANVFVNAPATVDCKDHAMNYNADEFIAKESGRAEVLADEAAVIAKIQELVTVLDENYGECDEFELNRHIASVPGDKLDVRAMLAECSDDYKFTEIKKDYRPELATGFIKLNGMTIGVIANAPYMTDGDAETTFDGTVSAAALRKAKQMVDFCAEYGIPTLNVVKASGIKTAVCTERLMPTVAAQYLKARMEAFDTSVTLIVGDTYGTDYSLLASKAFGNSMTMAWAGVKVGMLEAEKAVNILFADEDSAAKVKEAAKYEALQNSAEVAAQRGSIDMIINPSETRKHLIMAYSML